MLHFSQNLGGVWPNPGTLKIILIWGENYFFGKFSPKKINIFGNNYQKCFILYKNWDEFWNPGTLKIILNLRKKLNFSASVPPLKKISKFFP